MTVCNVEKLFFLIVGAFFIKEGSQIEDVHDDGVGPLISIRQLPRTGNLRCLEHKEKKLHNEKGQC